jgi:hypothetical protein
MIDQKIKFSPLKFLSVIFIVTTSFLFIFSFKKNCDVELNSDYAYSTIFLSLFAILQSALIYFLKKTFKTYFYYMDILEFIGYIGIYIIEIKNHQISLVIKPNDNVYTSIIPLNDGTFMTTELNNHKGYFFGDMKQWSVTANGNNWECISEKQYSHLSCIIGIIQLSNGNLISTSFDQKIKIWK